MVAAGLAALGIGAALGSAAPASAEPTGRGGSGEISHHVAARASNKPAARRAVTMPATRKSTRSNAPAVRAAVRPADVWSSLTTRLAGILGCDPRGRLITIYKGTHFVIPGETALWVRSDSGDATFIPTSVYDLKDSDQFDWNKMAGLTFTPLEPNRNAAMVVWRYNLTSDDFEIGPFFNDHYAYVFPTDGEIISVPVNQTFTYYVDYTGITISYGGSTVHKAYPSDLIPNFWTSARISGWFGGSEVAPSTVSYYKHVY